MSSSIHNREIKRLENTFKDFMQEYKYTFDRIDKTNSQIESDLNELKLNVYDSIKKNCSKQFQWLEQHGKVYFNDNGINVHVNENPDGMTADTILGELESCASLYDMGLRSYFDQANIRKNIVLKENQRCVNSCSFRSQDKIDEELKNCIRKCFINSFDETDALLDDIKLKLNDVKGRMELK